MQQAADARSSAWGLRRDFIPCKDGSSSGFAGVCMSGTE
jgi:hypothetical protein